MFRNYLVTAFRNLLRNKMASVISIAGLALGMSCALLIFLYVQFEYSFDRFHTKRDKIYRVTVEGIRKTPDRDIMRRASTGHDLAPRLQSEFAEVRRAVRMSPQTGTVRYEDQLFEENNFYIADPECLTLFDFPLELGDRETALDKPNTVVLTREMAEKYFGRDNPIGKVVKLKLSYTEPMPFTVTGVLAPIPDNSSIRINFLANKSFDALRKKMYQWSTLFTSTYVELADPSSVGEFMEKLKKFKISEFVSDAVLAEWHFSAEAFKDTYFKGRATYRAFGGVASSERKGNQLLVFLLVTLGILILAISCVNVMNLSTARAANRAKEIGIRKVIGADRRQLIIQFLAESVLLSVLSLILAMALVEVFLPYFNTMVRRELAVGYADNPGYLAAMAGIAVLVGILSGLYPAFFLSSFRPVETLKGENAPSSITLRKALMISQLVVSICILIFSLLITREARFIRDIPLGFDKENVIRFSLYDDKLMDRYKGLKTALLSVNGVAHVTASAHGGWNRGVISDSSFTCPALGSMIQQRFMIADPDYLRVYGIPVVEGENFPENKEKADSMCIINQTAKLAMGGGDVIGKKLVHGMMYSRQIIGVVDDFYFYYPTEKIEPLVIGATQFYWGLRHRYISVRLLPGDLEKTISEIGKTVKRFFPDHVFRYEYVDKDIERMHADRNDHWEIALKFSTGFSIFIACLGLFGFAEYETERKTKEIGIRKALGAARGMIAGHFVKEFVKIAIIANIVAWPLSFAFTRITLQKIDYPYPFSMGVAIFLIAGALTVLLTVGTVSVQTFRAASVNPVDALRDE